MAESANTIHRGGVKSAEILPFDISRETASKRVRARIENEIERLIGLLDAIDGDPDFEPDSDDEPWLAAGAGEWNADNRSLGDDREECSDEEESLGWCIPALDPRDPGHRLANGWGVQNLDRDDAPPLGTYGSYPNPNRLRFRGDGVREARKMLAAQK